MRFGCIACLIVLAVSPVLGCRKAPGRDLSVVVIVEAGGSRINARLDGADAKVTLSSNDKFSSVNLKADGALNLDASLFKSGPDAYAITLEIENQQTVKLRFEGLKDLAVKEMSAGQKPVGQDEAIAPGNHVFSVRGKTS